VPLLMSGPARFPAGRVVPDVVRLVDVAPTILDAMGWEAWPELEGKSLVPAWLQQSSPQLAAYGESYYGRLSFGWAPLRCLTTQRWKYIAAPGAELYDLAADPGEEHNVVQAHPDVAAQLAGALAEMVRTFRPRQADQVQLDGAARQRLVALGYVGGAMAADSDEDAKRRDPKDMLDVLRGLMNARSLAHDGRYQEIVGLLEPLVAASPESDALHGLLGQAYLELGRLDEAQRAYEASLRTVSDDPVNLCGLGDVLSGRGKPQDAVLCYRRALEVCPSYGQANSRLGLLYAQQGDFKLAEQHYREDLKLRPRSPNALSNLANVVLGQRRAAEAAALLRQALELDPGYAPAHQSYWRALLWSGATAPAVAALRQALGVMPGNADLQRELAWLLATARDSGVRNGPEALRWARECCSGEAATATDLHVLAAAHASNGQFDQAAKDARRALALCSDAQLSAQIAAHLAQFEAGRPIQGGF
jgi:tetratricopeptide (TPR) repeat protein